MYPNDYVKHLPLIRYVCVRACMHFLPSVSNNSDCCTNGLKIRLHIIVHYLSPRRRWRLTLRRKTTTAKRHVRNHEHNTLNACNGISWWTRRCLHSLSQPTINSHDLSKFAWIKKDYDHFGTWIRTTTTAEVYNWISLALSFIYLYMMYLLPYTMWMRP